MFSTLAKNSVFYILDKNTKPTVKVGKVTDVKINPQFYGLANQEMDISVDVNGDPYEFKKIPGNISIVSPSVGIVISDNPEDMIREYDSMVSNSRQVLDSIEYHQAVIDSRDDIMTVLNPRFAKEKEQEIKLTNLEGRVGNMEQGIDDIKAMLAKVLNAK
jgi:hypothetical protein